MNGQEITALVIVVVLVLWCFYDLIMYAFEGNSSTVSRVILETSQKYRMFALVVVFALGVLVGHLFLPQHE